MKSSERVAWRIMQFTELRGDVGKLKTIKKGDEMGGGRR